MYSCKFCEVEVQDLKDPIITAGARWMHTPNGDANKAYWFCERSVAWPKGER